MTKKRTDNKGPYNIFARYTIILLTGLLLPYIYKLLTPLTLHTLNILYSIKYQPILFDNMIRLPTLIIEIIPACVAGSAYYLLLILTLATKGIQTKTRIHILLLSFTSLFILNILRILILVGITGTTYFDTVHWLFWHLISTLFVVGIWITMTKIYKIKEVPFYSDFKELLQNTKR